MMKDKRHKRILSILHREGVLDIDMLVRLMPEVSRVTFRRDLSELAEAGALKRTHGGAVLPDAEMIERAGTWGAVTGLGTIVSALDDMDAVILPPIPGRGSDALRRDICRREIPFVAESAPQPGGAYLGPDNYRAGEALGVVAGEHMRGRPACVLVVGLHELPNTRQRAEGFRAGFERAYGASAQIHEVDGKGNYKTALRAATDALHADESINVVFGVNDHSVIAGIEAAERTGLQVYAYSTGGESAEFMGRLAQDGPLRAACAFFPEVVGAAAIDLVAAALAGEPLAATPTPYRIIEPANVHDYYERAPEGWRLRLDRESELVGPISMAAGRVPRNRRIGFLPHYPAHDWYRNMIQAMRARAETYQFQLIVAPPHHGIAAEIARLQRDVAQTAVQRIAPGHAVILGEGQAVLYMADEIRRLAFAGAPALEGVMIVTNALDVLHRLEGAPMIKVILTSGEYQKADRCLVGPSLGALFERLRPDRAFITAAGVSSGFGLSTVDERRALVAQRFIRAARHTTLLVDHTLLGTDASHRIARIEDIDEILTDDGALPADRQALRAAGVEVTIAGEAVLDLAESAAPPDQAYAV